MAKEAVLPWRHSSPMLHRFFPALQKTKKHPQKLRRKRSPPQDRLLLVWTKSLGSFRSGAAFFVRIATMMEQGNVLLEAPDGLDFQFRHPNRGAQPYQSTQPLFKLLFNKTEKKPLLSFLGSLHDAGHGARGVRFSACVLEL